MFEMKITLTAGELVALGYCVSAGLELAEKRKEEDIKQLILSLGDKIMKAEKPPVSE